MRSDELELRSREAADIGSVAAWPDWPPTKILRVMTARHRSAMSDEEIRARAGYGVQYQTLTCVVGQQLYPVPSRAIGGTFEKLDILPPGQTKWKQLDRADVTGSEEIDQGTTKPGMPLRYVVEDGFVRLLPSPSSALSIRFTFYIRPSQIVTSQCSTLGGDAVDRGRITSIAAIASRQVTVNALPFDQLLAVPAALSTGVQRVDVVRPSGTFALAAFSLAQTFSGLVFTFGGTESLARVQVGDYVRVEDQADWPMGLAEESHEMVAIRTAMEIARDIGVEEKTSLLGALVQADLERYRNMRRPQVKSQPQAITIRPMWARR